MPKKAPNAKAIFYAKNLSYRRKNSYNVMRMQQPKDIEISEIDTTGPLYVEACQLRYDLLRVPLGITHQDAEKFDFEKDAHHWVALNQGRVVGCVLLYVNPPKEGKLFQMVVAEDQQGKGIGVMLVNTLENAARQQHLNKIQLHSRLVALNFYRKLGYKAYGPIFAEVGIPHRRMFKVI